MVIVGIDPGTEQSAWVWYHAESDGFPTVHTHEILRNTELVERLRIGADLSVNATIVIEQIESFGMPVGREVFQTVFWTGRFAEAWYPSPYAQVPRRIVKQHLCHSARATDANIRQALIDRFGPTSEKAIGKKATPGPLYGLKSHEFAALAVAVTYYDTHLAQTQERIGTDGQRPSF